MRPGGLERLLQGVVTERSKEATASRRILEESLPLLEEMKGEIETYILRILDDGIRLTTFLDDDYPLNLRVIDNRPPFLFYQGALLQEEDARSVAVVGTREPSARGLAQARDMSRLLGENDVTVVSGLARGINTTAHEATLKAGGMTVAVLGSGIQRIYPRENAGLSSSISQRGAVVSQFWPDQPPAPCSFPRRNITMSGLALEHGKKVFLLRSLVDEHVLARNYIARGAHLVRDVDDILQKLQSTDEIKLRTEKSFQLSLGLE